jgi:hypothetical protein
MEPRRIETTAAIAMHPHTSISRAPLVALLALLSLHCRGAEPPLAASGVDVSDVEGCRSFAAVGSVRLNDEPGWQRCTFDAARAEQSCLITAGSERSSSVTEYASLADFVEAGRHVGKITGLRETLDEGGQLRRVSYRYDELGRVRRRIEEAHGRTSTTRYTDYDAAGRPRHATTESGGDGECSAWSVDIEYSDPEHRVLERSRLLDPERCGFVERTRLERYDAAGNRVAVETADAGGMARLFAARGAESTTRVCL